MQEMENQDNNRELWWTRLLVWNTHTLLPNISFKGLSPSAVMEEEIWAVKVDINIIPMIIHSEAYARPRNDLGVLSPYLPKKYANYKMKNVDILTSSTNSASQANLIVISVGKFVEAVEVPGQNANVLGSNDKFWDTEKEKNYRRGGVKHHATYYSCRLWQVLYTLKWCSYPTVVMVTMAHHKPSHMPLQNEFGNCPEFILWSCWKKRKLFFYKRCKQNSRINSI